MNIGSAMNLMSQGKQAWATFKQNHPEFPKFLNYVKNKGVPEGTVISIDEVPGAGWAERPLGDQGQALGCGAAPHAGRTAEVERILR